MKKKVAAKKKAVSKKKKNAYPGIGGGGNNFGFPANQGTPFSAQLSQPTTEFINLRWYLVSNMRQFLSEMYVELGLVQVICDLPVDDALRGGVKIKSQQLEESQIEELKNSMDRDDDINTVGQGAKWTRLYGGGGILCLTDQDPATPLRLDLITSDSPLEFRAVDMWELFWDKQNTEGYDPSIQDTNFEFYDYYGIRVHKSRVMRIKGLTAPSFIRPRLRGWGFSVVEALVRSINQYLKASDLTFEVLDEFKLDIYKIKNLINSLMMPGGQDAVQNRVQQANLMKNFQNAIVMDTEDDYVQKQLSFTGLAETMQQIRMQVASDMRMPLTKIFGISAAGFSSGEDDIDNYNAMVESQVRNKIKYLILRVAEIKCQKLFGFVPDDISLEFHPLKMMSEEQEENVKNSKFGRAIQALQAGGITMEEFRTEINKSKLLDISLEEFGGYMQDEVVEGVNQPYNPQDTDNPGASRLDTRKSLSTEVGGIGHDKVKAPQKAGNDPTDIARIDNSDFKEADHPRDDDGKFGKTGSGKNIPKHGTKAGEEGTYKGWTKDDHRDATKAHESAAEKLEKEIYSDPKREEIIKAIQKKKGQGRYPSDIEIYAEAKKEAPELAKKYEESQLHKELAEYHRHPKKGKIRYSFEKKKQNSDGFDKASYYADGGDSWIDERKKYFFEDPRDIGLWSQAEEEARHIFGKQNWKFSVWMYMKKGGQFGQEVVIA